MKHAMTSNLDLSLRPLLSQFQVDIPPESTAPSGIEYDEARMVLMISDRPAVESPEFIQESSTRITFVAQETRDDD